MVYLSQNRTKRNVDIGLPAILVVAVMLLVPVVDFGFADSTNFVDASGSLLAQILYSGAAIVALYLMWAQKADFRKYFRALLPATPFLFLALVSVFWSSVPEVTFRRAVRLIIEFSLFTSIAFLVPLRTYLRIWVYAALVATIADLAAALALPSAYTSLGFAGIHHNKNEAGCFYFFVVSVLFFSAKVKGAISSSTFSWGVLAAATFVLVLTQCRTVPIILLMSAFVCVFFWLTLVSRREERGILNLFAVLTVGTIFVLLMSMPFSEILGAFFSDPTLAGRGNIWQFTFDQFLRNPVEGLGYGALWQSGPWIVGWLSRDNLNWVMNEAHNGYLDVLAQLGLLGMVAAIFYLSVVTIQLYRWSRASQEKQNGYWPLYCVFVCVGFLLFNITESALFRTGAYFWTQFVVTAGFVARYADGSGAAD